MIESQAYILRSTGSVPELEEVHVDDNLMLGQVLVRVLFTSVCGTQLEEIFVSSRNKKYMPHLFGHEAMGEVVSVGPGVRFRKPGERVVVHWKTSSQGLDSLPGVYLKDTKALSVGKVITFSSFAVVPENRITLLPKGVESWQGPLLGCSLSTGWGAVRKTGKLREGESVLIVGLGGVGRAAAIAASQVGGVDVIAVDSKDIDKKDLTRMGINAKFSNLEDALLSYVKGQSKLASPQLVIDTVGSAAHFERMLDTLSSSTRLILVGMPQGNQRPSLNTQRLLDGFQIIGSNGGDVDPHQDFVSAATTLRAYVSGSGPGETVVMGWEKFAEGIELQRSSQVNKVIYSLP